MPKSLLLFPAVVLLVFATTSAPARPPQEPGGSPSANAPGKLSAEAHAKAKKLYDLDCALCHGPSGDGKTDLAKDMQLTLLDWTDPKSLASFTDQQLFDAIRKGKGKMPPEDDMRAKNEEVRYLVTYIRRMASQQTAAPTAQPAPAPAPSETPAPATPPAATPAPSK
jgi:cytochrome c oxidase cbb3-type subunit 3